jgi:hypothetical protein
MTRRSAEFRRSTSNRTKISYANFKIPLLAAINACFAAALQEV